jgi:hypothetical protein
MKKTTTLSVLSAAAIAAFGLLALGSGKDGGSSAGSATPGASGSPASGGSGHAVLATCNIKALGKCTENYGMVPTLAGDMCKSDEGTFSKGSTPCPQDGVVGTCEFKPKNDGEPGEMHYYYANAVGDPKGSCEALGAVWTAKAAPAASGAASAAPAASGAPAEGSAAPADTGAKPKAPAHETKKPAKK